MPDRRFAVAILLSVALHAALISFLPRSDGEKPREQRIMRVSLLAAQPQSPQSQPAPSPKPAGAPEPPRQKPKAETPKPTPATPAKPAVKPKRTPTTKEPRQGTPTAGSAATGGDELPQEGTGSTGSVEPESPGGSADGNASGSQSGAGIVDVDSLVVTKKILPDYPLISRKRRDRGTVTLLIEIENGRVSSASVERSSGHSPLDEAALRAVRGWQFDASGHGGKITARVPITFSLTK